GQSGGVTDVSGDTRLQSKVLESLSSAVRYRRWLADLARPYLGAHPIEIGSGNGDYAAEWVTPSGGQPAIVSFTATEADEERCADLARRFADHPVVRTRPLLLGHDRPVAYAGPAEAEPPHTAAVAYNVLEHIADDVAAVRAMAR